jgi:hypothetical protein
VIAIQVIDIVRPPHRADVPNCVIDDRSPTTNVSVVEEYAGVPQASRDLPDRSREVELQVRDLQRVLVEPDPLTIEDGPELAAGVIAPTDDVPDVAANGVGNDASVTLARGDASVPIELALARAVALTTDAARHICARIDGVGVCALSVP